MEKRRKKLKVYACARARGRLVIYRVLVDSHARCREGKRERESAVKDYTVIYRSPNEMLRSAQRNAQKIARCCCCTLLCAAVRGARVCRFAVASAEVAFFFSKFCAGIKAYANGGCYCFLRIVIFVILA